MISNAHIISPQVDKYCVSYPGECEQVAVLALQSLERCCRQCQGDGMHLASDDLFRNTLVLVPRMASACPSVLSAAIDLVTRFAKDGPYHELLRHLDTGEPCLELLVEQTMESLVRVAIAREAPLDSLADTKIW